MATQRLVQVAAPQAALVSLSSQAVVRTAQAPVFARINTDAIATSTLHAEAASAIKVQPAAQAEPSLQTLNSTLVRDHRAVLVRTSPRVSEGRVAAAIVRDHRTAVAVRTPDTGLKINYMRFVNVDLAHLVGKVQVPVEGVPRQEVQVPLSPTPEVTDEVVFEAAAGSQRYFVPRYSLAVEGSQYQISLEPSGQEWSLVVYLDRFAAPSVSGPEIQELPHEIAVVLTHNLLAGSTVVGRRELIFQEVTTAGSRIRATLRVPGLTERDQLYHALSDADYAAALTVRRIMTVAVPVPQARVVASGRNAIRGTWTFDFDTGIEGGDGDVWWRQQTATERQMEPTGQAQMVSLGAVNFDEISLSQLQGLNYSATPIAGNVNGSNQLTEGQVFAVRTNQGNYAKVKVLKYDYNLEVEWVTFSTDAQSSQSRFRETIRTLDCAIAPTPFLFSPTLHGYVYRQLNGISGRSSDLKRFTVNSHHYYQDLTKPNRFFTLPDSFKLARRAEIPHRPLASVQVIPAVGEALDNAQVTLRYAALPYLNPARLKAATPELLSHVPAEHHAKGLEFDRLEVDPAKTQLRVAMPGSGLEGPYRPRPGAVVDVKNGIADILTLTLTEFQPIFDGMFSDSTVMFGQVTVDLGDPSWTEPSIPFVARMDDLIGEIFNYNRQPEVSSGQVVVSLQNTLESPVRVNTLAADLRQSDRIIAVQSITPSVALPVVLNPGDALSLTLTPAEALGTTQSVEAVFDFSGVRVQPNRQAIWEAIFDPTVSVQPSRPVKVTAVAEMFTQENPQGPVQAIVVDFEHSAAVRLTPDAPEVDTQISLPMSAITAWALKEEVPDSYRYRVTLIHRNGRQTRLDWQTDSSDYLYPQLA